MYEGGGELRRFLWLRFLPLKTGISLYEKAPDL